MRKLSTKGYRKDSPDKNNPYNIIPSGNITMKGVDFPVLGIDNLGNVALMFPGKDYIFPGQYVLEIPYMQSGGTSGMDGMIKARLAIDSHFGNPTARRITNYDTRSYEFSDGKKGNVYVSSYDNLVTPQIQDVNGKLMFINNPWSDENADRSYEQSMKFERPEDAKYFGENYKKYAPMMNLYKKQGGIHIDPENRGKFTKQAEQRGMTVQEFANYVLNNKDKFDMKTIKRANFARNAAKWNKQTGGEQQLQELINQIQEAIQQGKNPEDIVSQLVEMGMDQEQAIQLVQHVQSQSQAQTPMYQQGGTQTASSAQQQIVTQIQQAFQQGADPNEIVQQLVQNGLSQEKAVQLVQYAASGGQQAQMSGQDEQIQQLVEQIRQALSQSVSPEKILSQLVQNGMSEEQAQELIQYAMSQEGSSDQNAQIEQIVEQIRQALEQGVSEEEIKQALVQQGLSEEQAVELIEYAKSGASQQSDAQGQQQDEQLQQVIAQIKQALEQGVKPEEVVQYLVQQGVPQEQAQQRVEAATSYKYGGRVLPKAQGGVQMPTRTVGNLAVNPNVGLWQNLKAQRDQADKQNRDVFSTANALAALANFGFSPFAYMYLLPDNAIKGAAGLASGLAGSYLGYAKLFSDDKITNNTPTATIGKNPNAQIQAPYRGTESEKALPTPWGKGYDLPKELNPYDGNSNIQGTNQYSTFQKRRMKKYPWTGQKTPVMDMTSMNQMNPEFSSPFDNRNLRREFMRNASNSASSNNNQDVTNIMQDRTTGNLPTTNPFGFVQDKYGEMAAINALIGLSNFNNYLRKKQDDRYYQREFHRVGNTSEMYTPINYVNPFGDYTINNPIGPNFGLVAQTPVQDFGTTMQPYKKGGVKKYKKGGVYDVTAEELYEILKNGGDFEIIE